MSLDNAHTAESKKVWEEFLRLKAMAPEAFPSDDESHNHSQHSDQSRLRYPAMCPRSFPYASSADAGRICYTDQRHADKGHGPCESWCTLDASVGSGCGNNSLKLCPQATCPRSFPYPSSSDGGKICYKDQRHADEGHGPCESWCTLDLAVGDGCGNNEHKLCPQVSNFEPNKTSVVYVDRQGDLIEFVLESGHLVQYVNHVKKVGASDTSGIVTKLTIHRTQTGKYDIRDQGGWGSDDYPASVVVQLHSLARETGVALEESVEAITTTSGVPEAEPRHAWGSHLSPGRLAALDIFVAALFAMICFVKVFQVMHKGKRRTRLIQRHTHDADGGHHQRSWRNWTRTNDEI